MKLAHIVNPFRAKKTSDLYIAQPITFKSMKTAQNYANQNSLEVSLYSAQYPEDIDIIPDYFIKTPDLNRSILDYEAHIKRKLPFIGDVFDRLYEVSKADYFIYTNIDIALMPNFYVAVHCLINKGYDAFCINRRTINIEETDKDDLHWMYSQIGDKHGGVDCFVFPRKQYPQYKFFNVFLGYPPIETSVLINMEYHSKQFKIFEDLHLTFHIGNDGEWRKDHIDNSGEWQKWLTIENSPEEINYTEVNKVLNYYLNKGYISSLGRVNYFYRIQQLKNKGILNKTTTLSQIKKYAYKKLYFLAYKLSGLARKIEDSESICSEKWERILEKTNT